MQTLDIVQTLLTEKGEKIINFSLFLCRYNLTFFSPLSVKKDGSKTYLFFSVFTLKKSPFFWGKLEKKVERNFLILFKFQMLYVRPFWVFWSQCVIQHSKKKWTGKKSFWENGSYPTCVKWYSNSMDLLSRHI